LIFAWKKDGFEKHLKWFPNFGLGSRTRRKPMKKLSPANGGMSSTF
jgi:hypothetical protein